MNARRALWLEWTLLFLLPPLVAVLGILPGHKLLVFLAPLAYVLWRAAGMRSVALPQKKDFDPRRPLLLFVLFMPLLQGLAVWLTPGPLFQLPRELPALWLLILLLYPLLSVLPQEFAYRWFYFRRYQVLFPQPWQMLLSNALVFAWLHVMYGNAIAVLLSLCGGLLFAWSYARSGRLLYPWLEHSLYGQWLFTLGLGAFFYHAG